MIVIDRNNEIKKIGIEDSFNMSINKSNEVEAHIIKILTEDYSDPIGSFIRETISNHYDSHVENLTPDKPIYIKIDRMETGKILFESSDEGLGLSLEEFDKYYMGIGESSKRGKENLIGAKGLGAKSFLAYEYGNSYKVTCIKNGLKNVFLVYKGETVPERTILIKNLPTIENNGVTITVEFEKEDMANLIFKIKEQLAYFPTIIFSSNLYMNHFESYRIFENDLFKWSELSSCEEMHISFGYCKYPISWKDLGLKKINLPVGIKIPIDSGIDVTFNREAIRYDSFSKKYILDRIEKTVKFFIEKWNKENKFYPNFKTAYENSAIFNGKYVKILDKAFNIEELKELFELNFTFVEIKDITKNAEKIFDIYKYDFFKQYKNLGLIGTNNMGYRHNIQDIINNKYIIVSRNPTKLKKQFFIEKYKGYYLMYKEKEMYYADASSPDYYKNYQFNYAKYFDNTIDIDSVKKIEEELLSYCIDFTDLDGHPEFILWNKKRKEKIKSNITVNKNNKEDININICTDSHFYDKAVFKPGILNLEQLNVYLDSDFNMEYIKRLYLLKKAPYINFITLNKPNMKKIKEKNLPNCVTFEEFKNTKPFYRICTALLFKKLFIKYDFIFHYRAIPLNLFDKKLSETVKEIEKYISDNIYINSNIINNEFVNAMLLEAQKNKSWDNTIIHHYNYLENKLENLSFLKYIKQTNYLTDLEKKEIVKIINKLTLINKKEQKWQEEKK